MPSRYDPLNWYWIVGGTGNHVAEPGAPFTGDDSRVFSSALNTYVPATDATYVAWQAACIADVGFDMTTRIDTEANLAEVLGAYGVTANFAGQP